MKKIVAMVSLLLLVSAAGAFAASPYTGAAGAQISAGVSGSEKPLTKLSTGVKANIAYDNNSYAAATKHDNGTKEYGSSSGDTRIYSKDVTALDSITVSDSSSFSGWTTL